MPMIHQLSDMVWIRTDDGHDYGDTPENFARDFGQGLMLPPDITSREYVPGIRHTLKIGNDVVDGGPMPWPLGDEILKAKARCEARKTERDVKSWREYTRAFHEQQELGIAGLYPELQAQSVALVTKWMTEMRAAQDESFIARVAALSKKVAQNVMGEGKGARRVYADRMLRGLENPRVLAWRVIKSKGLNASDADISSALANFWTDRARTQGAFNGDADSPHTDAR